MDERMAVDIAARRAGRADRGGSESRRRYERELVVLYQRDPGLRDAVLRALLPLARGIARRYWRGDEPIEDLEQVATVGLLKALKAFDPSRGTSFAAYAIPTMNGELRRHYRDTGWAVHVPRGTQELALKLARAEREAAGRNRRAPTAAELADAFDTTPEAVVEARMAANGMRAGSLDRPIRSDQPEGEVLAAIVDGDVDEGFTSAERWATLGALAEELPERDRQVLALRYAGDLSQSEIGRRVGVSQMQVSRILRRAITRLQDAAGVDVEAA
jgi:RNA polymerase sigma-B factor